MTPAARTLPLLALTLFGWLTSTNAQTVRWQLPDPYFSIGKATPLELIFENCSPRGNPNLPKVDGLEPFGAPVGRQKQVSIVNFRPTNREVLSYFVRPTRSGRIEIPSFEVETNAGTITVPALSIEADDQPRLSATGERVDRLVRATLETPATEIWEGEVFPVRYEVLLLGNQQASLASDPSTWQPDGVFLAPWPDSQSVRRNLGGILRMGRLFETKAMALRSGTLNLPPIEMDVELVSARTFGLFSPFGGGQSERIRIASNPLQLKVQSLPQPAAPGFTGAVGQFRLESRLTPETVAVGEPVTWSLTLRGTGNWPTNFSFPTRRVPGSMRVIEPEVRRDANPDKPFEASATQDIVIIPREPGTFDIPAIQFSFFNPATGQYETLATEPAQLVVTGDQPGGTQGTALQLNPPATGDRPPVAQAEPEPGPAALPRDPLNGTGTSLVPLPLPIVLGLGSLLLLALLPFWFTLARLDAVRHHPNYRRELAWKEARQVLARWPASGANPRPDLLRWQQAIARSQGVDISCPTLSDLAATPLFRDEHWTTLWQQADACLYGDLPLPDDWRERALAASAGFRPPTVPWSVTFRPAHWFPVLALLIHGLPGNVHAQNGAEAYRGGDFPAARAAWESALQEHPGDWVARNNLGLTLAQQGDWDQATAHWIRAWLAQPGQSDLRWNLGLGLTKASYRVPQLHRLTSDRWDSRLATFFPPAGWQLTLLGGCLLMASGCAWFLLARYQHQSKAHRTALSLVVTGVVLVGLAALALNRYGLLADPAAALVVEVTPLKSIPTDAPTDLASKAAPAGLLVRREKEFLGWSKVRLANNETGWLRSETLLPLH